MFVCVHDLLFCDITVCINLYSVCVLEYGRCEYGRSQRVVWGATWQRRCWSCTVTADEWVWSSGTPPAAASSSVLAMTIRYHISTTQFRLHQQHSEFSCITRTTVPNKYTLHIYDVWNEWLVQWASGQTDLVETNFWAAHLANFSSYFYGGLINKFRKTI